MSQPKRRKLRFHSLRDATTDAQQLRRLGYQRAGNWTLAQNLDHLNRSMQMAVDGSPFFMPALVRPILRMIFMPVMRRGIQIGMRASAPKPLRPAESPDEQATADRFERLVDQLLDPTVELVSMHPLLGKFTREQWLVMQTWHAAHHLSFLVPNPPDESGA